MTGVGKRQMEPIGCLEPQQPSERCERVVVRGTGGDARLLLSGPVTTRRTTRKEYDEIGGLASRPGKGG